MKESKILIKFGKAVREAREAKGYSATRELLKLPQPPDAIFTSNGLLSAGALRALRESSLEMPGEIAFATFDETPWSTIVDPPLTVIEQQCSPASVG